MDRVELIDVDSNEALSQLPELAVIISSFDPFYISIINQCVYFPPAGAKSVDELKEIIKISNLPFIVKGVMTVKGALKAKEAGAYAIVVSNHGGRVLDQCPSTAEVLEDIVKAVGDSMKVFVDGGIRSGVDVFKALALGADGVLICRTFVTALYGGEEAGVKSYIEKLASELEDTMAMCGAYSINEITRDMIRY